MIGPSSTPRLQVGLVALGSRIGRSGGVDVYTRTVAEQLARLDDVDLSVSILVDRENARGWEDRDWPERVRPVLVDGPAPPSLATRIGQAIGVGRPSPRGRALRTARIDALGLDLVHFPRTTIPLPDLATPSILTYFDMQHEFHPEVFSDASLVRRRESHRRSVEQARRVIAPSEFTRRTLVDRYGTPEELVEVIPIGLGDRVEPTPDVVASHGIPTDFLLYPANPWPHKNHARLMSALRIYSERYGERLDLVLTGSLGHAGLRARDLALAAGVEDQVFDLGFVSRPDLVALLRAASSMIFPSWFEGFGIPLIEAMDAGCPILAADATSIPEVTDGAALLFDPLDPGAIARAIREVRTDDAARRARVERGRQVVRRFDGPELAARLVAAYRSAARSSPGAGR